MRNLIILALLLSACTSETEIQTEQVKKSVEEKDYQSIEVPNPKSTNIPLTNYKASIDCFKNHKFKSQINRSN